MQYRVKTRCSNPCRARGELRTRTGRRTFATAPLPGDGKVVLGTRLGLKLPTTKKVRFYITISKAALLKTPFHTEGGSRIAETRLRVWLKTPSGEVLTVRDGRIKVSIARIKSGALPGLKGDPVATRRRTPTASRTRSSTPAATARACAAPAASARSTAAGSANSSACRRRAVAKRARKRSARSSLTSP